MKLLLGYNMKIVIYWGEELKFDGQGGESRWGGMRKYLAGGGGLPPVPHREEETLLTTLFF